MPRLLEWLKAARAADPSHLQEHKTRGAVTLAVWSTILAPGSILHLAIDARSTIITHALAIAVLNVVGYSLLALILRRPLARRHADVLLLVLGAGILADFAIGGLRLKDGSNDLIVFAPIVPLAFSAFTPLRPSHALGLSGVAALVVGVHLLGARLPLDPKVVGFSTVAIGITSAAAAHRKRRILIQLDEARAQLVASERMSVLGKMTAGIAHELKTPLAAAMNGAESLRGLSAELRESVGHASVTEDDIREIVGEIDSSIQVVETGLGRASQFIQAVRSQTVHLNETQCDAFRVADVVSGVVMLLSHTVKKGGLKVDTLGVDPDASVRGDSGKMGQVITNLLVNAIDACTHAGRGTVVTIGVSPREGGLLVVVEDDGPGVPEAIRERMFEPLFTTKGKRGGTGLGLAISRDIVEGAFGGTLRLVRTAIGSRFEIFCPAGAARAARAAAWVPATASADTAAE
ncbi:MAG TPA: HAMP domain-containing sensor histidine kinase [Labilithrix sp.]|nr:HAMP domain-containing sensor histidine kinase [Labilithrix sp.]